jgi:hypothetical protein
VHAAVLGAIALTQMPLNPTFPLDPEDPVSDGAEPDRDADDRPPSFPLPHRDEPWFDAIGPVTLTGHSPYDEDRPESDAIACLDEPRGGWGPIEPSDFPLRDGEQAARLTVSAAGACASHAARGGWRGHGRVFVRVVRRDDGRAIATTTPLDDDARDEALLCCLRQAQAPVVSMLRPGGAVRFVLTFDVDPAQRHVSVAHTAASRRGGGAAALAMVQGAFTE